MDIKRRAFMKLVAAAPVAASGVIVADEPVSAIAPEYESWVYNGWAGCWEMQSRLGRIYDFSSAEDGIDVQEVQ